MEEGLESNVVVAKSARVEIAFAVDVAVVTPYFLAAEAVLAGTTALSFNRVRKSLAAADLTHLLF